MHNSQNVFKVKDHSVSGEVFELRPYRDYEILATYPQPSVEKLPEYYKSENYISHTDKNRNFLEIVYKGVRKLTIRQKLKHASRFAEEGKYLLDYGCGTGDFLSAAKKSGWTITGIEPHNEARQIANSKTNNSVYTQEYITSLEKHSFDVITLWHVLEHLPNLDTHIKQFQHLLKPNGTLIIAVPNYKSYDAQYYKSFWAAYDVPRHLWHFSKRGITQLFSKYYFTIQTILPMPFDAYYVSLLSEKYKHGKMNPLKAVLIGCRSNYKAKRTGEYSSLIYVLKNKQNAI